ncbi:putative glutamate receptor [Halictus rubicundus]|uniref:putative glutamate receptor n=1 Tax=Halictus rubicundus TaxID=77578 RepID=UPI0040374D33
MRLVRWLLVCSTIFRRAAALDETFPRLIVDSIDLLFPPITVSAHLCRLGQEDAIELSREMSTAGLIHEIYRDSDGYNGRLRDPENHRMLRVLDLDCDYAIPMLLSANEIEMFDAPNRWLLLRDRRSSSSSDLASIASIFEDARVLPNSEVFLATSRANFTEIRSIYRRSMIGEVVIEDRGTWTADGGLCAGDLIATSRRRRDLHGTRLKACIVVTDPDTINHLTDYGNKHIDTVTKANYAWLLIMMARINATIDICTTKSWGYPTGNGSWSGMTGMVQRREIDIGGTGMFLIHERLDVVEYLQIYTRMRFAFIFRQPLLSSVNNIFTMPFHRSVWHAIGVFLFLVLVMLCLSTKWEFIRGTSDYWQSLNPAEQTFSDNLMVVLGAVAQQGYYYEPYRVPPRIVTLMLLIAAMSLYASYTANIVTLLQSSTDMIKTPADLLVSPLKFGAQDILYARHYFKEFTDPVKKAIVEQKIEPKGGKHTWMSLSEGIHRMRTEMFAMHVDLGAAYNLVQDTFLEEEKCGIEEIDILNKKDPLMIIQVGSPYREVLRNAAFRVHETGLKNREERLLFTQRPKCHGTTNFLSIGITECYFALVSMGYGALLSLFVLVLELLWYKWRHRPTNEIDWPLGEPVFDTTVVQRPDTDKGFKSVQ